jgi:hypothetical protein
MFSNFRRLRDTAILVVVAFAAISPARGADGPNLTRSLHKSADAVMQLLQREGCSNVGVLKFLVAVGDGPLRDDAGPLNATLADRLEVALALASPEKADPDEEIGVVTRASSAVARSGNRRASHRTPVGRAEFFRLSPKLFTRSWGSEEHVLPDAFVTGEARLAADLRTLQVKIQVFTKKDPAKLVSVDEFTAPVDARTLTETGLSFTGARGALDDEKYVEQVVKGTVKPTDPLGKRKEKEIQFASWMQKEAPVRITLLYNGREVPIKEGSVETPREGEKVAFRLENRGDETYGVALFVNGENTIFKERVPPLYGYKWILEPGKTVTVQGFQKNDDTRESFRVLSPEESDKDEVNYGDNAGTFTVVVFRSTAKSEEAVVKAEAARPVIEGAISRGTLTFNGEARPMDLKAFKTRLKARVEKESAENSRGLIGKGAETESQVVRVPFTPYPNPVFSATIRYHQPRR